MRLIHGAQTESLRGKAGTRVKINGYTEPYAGLGMRTLIETRDKVKTNSEWNAAVKRKSG